MKYIISIPDGASDILSAYPDGNTPMRVSDTPTLDEMANYGQVGWAKTVPNHLPPGSDVACLSIFGYNPGEVYTGRAPLEAASMGIALENLYAYRCNLVTVEDGRMKEFTAGHISTEEAGQLIDSLNKELAGEEITFYTGVQYRHIMTTVPKYGNLNSTPPHDILDQEIEPHLPSGPSEEMIRGLMERSRKVFEGHPVNQKRISEGKPPATQIWLWGQGTAPALQTYENRCGKHGGVISAVDLIKGIGRLAGLNVIEVEGATGLPDTNYEGKAQAALDELRQHDFVLIHVEATDEMGHAGDEQRKTKAMTDFDQRLMKIVIDGLRSANEEFRIVLLPDHPTPISIRTHVNEPVPFLLYDSRRHSKQGDTGYSEWGVRERTDRVVWGYRLLDVLCETVDLDDPSLIPN